MLRIVDVYPGSDFFFIPDPNFFHPGSASKNSSILTQRYGFYALGNIIRVVHPGSRSWLFIHPGSRGQKSTGSRIRNTDPPDPDPLHRFAATGPVLFRCHRRPSGTRGSGGHDSELWPGSFSAAQGAASTGGVGESAVETKPDFLKCGLRFEYATGFLIYWSSSVLHKPVLWIWTCRINMFWASWIRIRLSGNRIRIVLSSSKNSKKTPDSKCFVTYLWLFIFYKWCKCTF